MLNKPAVSRISEENKLETSNSYIRTYRTLKSQRFHQTPATLRRSLLSTLLLPSKLFSFMEAQLEALLLGGAECDGAHTRKTRRKGKGETHVIMRYGVSCPDAPGVITLGFSQRFDAEGCMEQMATCTALDIYHFRDVTPSYVRAALDAGPCCYPRMGLDAGGPARTEIRHRPRSGSSGTGSPDGPKEHSLSFRRKERFRPVFDGSWPQHRSRHG